MNRSLFFQFFLFVLVAAEARESKKRLSSTKLVCYYGRAEDAVSWKCSHVVLPQEADVEAAREKLNGVKILLHVDRINEKLLSILKSSKVDGLDINLKKLDSKHDISDFVSTMRTKLGTDLFIALSVPAKSEILAKHYDFKSLSRHVDLFILQTAFLGPSKNVTFHPSRLSGLWDMQNTDSVVDLVTGLGAPLSKLVVTAPVQAFKFVLQDKKHTAPGSPALEVRSITRDELCKTMSNGGNWTLERDQDQAGPYVFSEKHWIAFDDPTSIDIKAKYARVRGLAGLALKDLSQDGGSQCGGSLLDAAYNGLSRQSRAPRGAVLHSLEREILETPTRPLDTVQVSPYRISRVIDVEGNVHVIRQDTRTEFECARQGYFVHPRSCGRFYRCVKFDQLSDEFNVFEFDCPAGLTFDNKFEVCVWPGSLSYSSPCSGSSEIAPVPRQRFICPGEPGYYADPENCRWFFACLDHGKSPLSAYEFRCPFGLVFDEERLVCEWPWLVPRCATSGILLTQTQEFVHGNAFKALEQYDGLGQLGVVKLGGLAGNFVQPPAKVYTSAGQAIFDTVGQSHIAGIDASRLGVSAGIAKAQEDAHLINAGLLGGISASVRPAIGNINIVGAGYSAVGVAASASNADIQISHDGSARYDSVTAVPNAFSTVASVPFVSSVPFPTLNASELEGFNGGVVANLPQLQYKVKSPSNIFFDTNSNLENETLFVNYVSSTPSPFVKVGERYEYANTAIPFVPNSGAKITVVSSTPATSYVESSEGIIAQPVVPIFRQEVSGGPIVSTYNYQKEAGVSYGGAVSTERPEIAVVQQQQPVVEFGQKLNVPAVQYSYQSVGASAKSSGASGYQYQVGGVGGEIVQPVQYSYQNVAKSSGASGYQYQGQQVVTGLAEKEEKVALPVYSAKAAGASGYQYHGQQQVVTEVPVVEQKVQAPVLQYSYQNAGTVAKAAGESGYQYHGQQQVVTEVPVVEQKVQFVTPAPVVQYSYQNTGAGAGGSGYQYREQQQVVSAPVVEQKVQFVTPAPVVQYSYENAGAVGKANSYQADGKVNFGIGGSYEYKNPAYVAVPQINQVVQEVPAAVTFQTHDTLGRVGAKIGAQYLNYSFATTPSAVVSGYSYQNVDHSAGGGYVYTKPAVKFEETPVTYSTPAPTVVAEVRPVVTYSTPAPAKVAVSYNYPAAQQPVVPAQVQPVVTYSTPATTKVVGYNYPKVVQAEVQPIVTYSTPAPIKVAVEYNYPEAVQPIAPAPVVQQRVEHVGYSYPKPQEVAVTYSTPAPVAIKETIGYSYPKPNVVFEEKPAAVVQGYHYPKPSVVFEEKPLGYSYPKPTVTFEEKPIVVEEKGYSYPKPAVVFEEKVVSTTAVPTKVKKPIFKGYDYPKPSIVFSEGPVYEEPFVKKTAYVTGNQGGSYQYVAPVVSSTVAPKKYSQSVDASYAYYNNYNAANAAAYEQAYYAQPREEVYVPSTPQSGVYVSSTPQAVTYVSSTPQPVTYVSSTPRPVTYVSSTPRPVTYVSSTPRPVTYVTSKPRPVTYVASTPKPTFPSVVAQAANLDEAAKFYSVSTTPRPVVQTYSTPPTVVTQSPPISRYVFSSLDEQYQTSGQPAVVTTKAEAPQTYLPPETTYLPARTTAASTTGKGRYVESYLAPELQTVVTTQAPRPKAVMIIKENDFHPLLSAKLGAQCTCVSNTLKLNKPPAVILTTTPETEVTDDADSIEIENYRAQGTPAPEITIKSTTNPVQPAPAPVYAVRKRVRVRPTTTVAYEEAASDVVSEKSDKELADSVRKGLNLIKAAAKEGAREALNSPAFDRYGPGGWRSRDEKLQGTIDCQRAGLFRHPTQCNKFYACRWDCDKNRFTLHVFNCPVHLTFDSSLGACNWPSQGPACLENTLLPSE